jgi:hypothetical protein
MEIVITRYHRGGLAPCPAHRSAYDCASYTGYALLNGETLAFTRFIAGRSSHAYELLWHLSDTASHIAAAIVHGDGFSDRLGYLDNRALPSDSYAGEIREPIV